MKMIEKGEPAGGFKAEIDDLSRRERRLRVVRGPTDHERQMQAAGVPVKPGGFAGIELTADQASALAAEAVLIESPASRLVMLGRRIIKAAKKPIHELQLRENAIVLELAAMNGISVEQQIKLLKADIEHHERIQALPKRKATSAERRILRNEMERRMKELSPFWRKNPAACRQAAFNQIRKATS